MPRPLSNLIGLAIVALVCCPAPIEAQEGLGAVGPQFGTTELEIGGGVLFALPQGTVAARAGTGAGSSLELRYTNVGLLAHALDARIGWGAVVTEGLALGVALRTGVATLEKASDIAGIAWTNLALGNDWVAGADLVVTWLRPSSADITLSLGATMTVAGVRYTSFSEAEYRSDPELRALDAAIQGEWDLRENKRLFIRLQALAPLHTQLIPLGFLPTATGGVSWRF
jgi:hypothetical protein